MVLARRNRRCSCTRVTDGDSNQHAGPCYWPGTRESHGDEDKRALFPSLQLPQLLSARNSCSGEGTTLPAALFHPQTCYFPGQQICSTRRAVNQGRAGSPQPPKAGPYDVHEGEDVVLDVLLPVEAYDRVIHRQQDLDVVVVLPGVTSLALHVPQTLRHQLQGVGEIAHTCTRH